MSGKPERRICWLFLLSASFGAAQPALVSSDFSMAAPQGFGDRQNSWPWSMEWFNGNLYVGTLRSADCIFTLGNQQTYPPTDSDVSCAANPLDLALQAEIWSWSPLTNVWRRVFQSPQDLAIPGKPGSFVARDIGFRGMTIFAEPDGTQALYVSGCSANTLYPGLPGGRLLRSVDGINFTPVPQNSGTVLGNIGNTCFRGAATFDGKFYIATANLGNVGVLLEATNPQLGDNNFHLATPASMPVSEVVVFNNQLYVSVSNSAGFTLARSSATGTPPYTFTNVMVNAGYSNSALPNVRALSLQVFDGYLYVGGESTSYLYGAELFRVHADDTWDLIVGTSRNTPVGMKTALSGFRAGFDWPFDDTFERMEIFQNRLYLGTFDASDAFHAYSNPTFQALVRPLMGSDLWVTTDGVQFTRVSGNGFGDLFNQGVRTIKTTPYGLFVGTANWFYGLEVWLGVP